MRKPLEFRYTDSVSSSLVSTTESSLPNGATNVVQCYGRIRNPFRANSSEMFPASETRRAVLLTTMTLADEAIQQPWKMDNFERHPEWD